MGAKRGTFIVIEGTDGSGKGTQFQLLHDRLKQAGYSVEAFDFPQYDQPSSYFVSQYLNGTYGSADEVGPYTASLFYALDRFEAAPRIRKALDEGKIIISNRYTGSSMGHQGTKFRSAEERRGYFIWLDNLEFEMLHIPRPDISFVLRVPAAVAQTLVDQKADRAYTDKKRDIHEADLAHLEGALAVYDDMTQLFPKDFQRIDCVRGGKLLDVDTIQSMLWEKIAPLLPQPPQLEMPMPVTRQEVAAITEDIPAQSPQAPAQAAPAPEPEAVTNPAGDVYAFTTKLPAAIVAAVIASLSRSGGSLSIKVLEEFAAAATKDQSVLARTVQTYGGDAPRLVSQQVVVAGASSLLATVLRADHQLVSITPQSRYVHYEQKDANGMYKYFLPTELQESVAVQYRQHLDHIFDLYSAMLPQLSAHLQQTSGVPPQGRSNQWQAAMHAEAHGVLQAILPVAATSTVALYGSSATFSHSIAGLLGSALPEALDTGQKILHELRTTIPAFIDVPGQTDAQGANSTYQQTTRQAVSVLAAEYLPGAHAAQTQPIQLLAAWPRNELDLVADMLYEYADLPLADIQRQVATWSYTRKVDVFEAYIGNRLDRSQRPGSSLEKTHYSWDITADYQLFGELQRYTAIEHVAWQALTPRYGYIVPAIIEAAGLSDQFEACFDTSLALYSLLQAHGYEAAAQYATLQGHKMRFQLGYNARQAFRIHEECTALHATPQLRELVEQLHEKLSETHPLIGEAMLFVAQ